ncbi:SagB-type dehydrogenase family enzyme [Hydrogenivirga caldilitoris]|uniref:SagB-type dehydrogenase family enzyme n=1 Tax=Hydrogenivirga caldilitoris TaxID=246264 RepID=A0A497XSY2_9AQUI|nr:SagB/ThcOx family dehydrogenase [Hydrogenivirga caldilitoris]RLJ70023.1 SagB-type dehydrogenase family enzyme [Hydrogenivirga caldilitoris]
MGLKLPQPSYRGRLTLEEALLRRRSVREYLPEPLSLEEVSQLLWAAQGVTDPYGFRTAPSAGALYPLEVYIHATYIDGLETGIYRYDPHRHYLIDVKMGNYVRDIYTASLSQAQVLNAPLLMMFFAIFGRTTAKYGKRGIRYVFNEVGHAGQNVYLQATSLGLGTVVIGAFYDEELKSIVGTRRDEEPLYIMPVGRVE